MFLSPSIYDHILFLGTIGKYVLKKWIFRTVLVYISFYGFSPQMVGAVLDREQIYLQNNSARLLYSV